MCCAGAYVFGHLADRKTTAVLVLAESQLEEDLPTGYPRAIRRRPMAILYRPFFSLLWRVLSM